MKSVLLVALCSTCLYVTPFFAQADSLDLLQNSLRLTKKDSTVKAVYVVGVSYTFIDDSGDAFDQLFSVDDQWNALSYPSQLSFGKLFKSGVGLTAIASYNKYKVGKFIDGAINQTEQDYYSLDARFSYDLNKFIGETGWFDPYAGFGLGYTKANAQGRGTYNLGFGFRTWFSDHWGLDFNTSGKWALGDNNATNHLQHSAGLVYRFGVEKGLTKKGAEKLDLIKALAAAQKIQQDSIAAANLLIDNDSTKTQNNNDLEKEQEASLADYNVLEDKKLDQSPGKKTTNINSSISDERVNNYNLLSSEDRQIHNGLDGKSSTAADATETSLANSREVKETNGLADQSTSRIVESNETRERNAKIEREILALGTVYFDLNSSYLSAEAKVILNKIAILLKKHKSVRMAVSSHTDARGSSAYNNWLSERRVARTVSYLIQRGVIAEQLSSSFYGEDKLTNHCNDFIDCSEEEHQANRRSEFKILN